MESFRFGKELRLPNELRKELRKVHGKLIQEKRLVDLIKGGEKVYAVGDVTVEALLDAGVMPSIAIFDYRVGRKDVKSKVIANTFPRPVKVRNGRGRISKGLWLSIKKAGQRSRSTGIRVYGEEDLASVACAYLASNGSVLLYGLPGRGIILVRITPAVKRLARSILERMDKE